MNNTKVSIRFDIEIYVKFSKMIDKDKVRSYQSYL